MEIPKFTYYAIVTSQQDLKYTRMFSPKETLWDIDKYKYLNAIKAFIKSKGKVVNIDYEYDESIFEGLSPEDYAKKYPIYYSSDGYVTNVKK